jgi:hypothetical protein
MASSFTMFRDHTQRRATVGRTLLDEWSARRRDLYLTTHNRKTSTPPVGFELTIAADLRLRPRGHWNRQHNTSGELKSNVNIFTDANSDLTFKTNDRWLLKLVKIKTHVTKWGLVYVRGRQLNINCQRIKELTEHELLVFNEYWSI